MVGCLTLEGHCDYLRVNEFQAKITDVSTQGKAGGLSVCLFVFIPSVKKRHTQAGSEHQLVLFLPGGGIGDVIVAEIVLPSQPFDDPRDGAESEINSVVALAGCQVREKGYVLDQGGVFSEF